MKRKQKTEKESEEEGSESESESEKETKPKQRRKEAESEGSESEGEEQKKRKDRGSEQEEEEEDESDSEAETEITAKEKENEEGSCSDSSLPSLDEDELKPVKNSKPVKSRREKKPREGRRKKSGSPQAGEEHPSIRRLKRYVTACGAHRNYKRLFEGRRSNKEKIQVLRRELEELGVQGERGSLKPSLEKCKRAKLKREEKAELASLDLSNIIEATGKPSLEKCKRAKLKREEKAELASLDLSNIIEATDKKLAGLGSVQSGTNSPPDLFVSGRPRRKAAAMWDPFMSPRASLSPPRQDYRKCVQSESESGSGQESGNHGAGGKRKVTDWENLKGIISDDAGSD
ncbi:UNVERIFIED_CONTAM: hypothetical protein FKN15_022298 [Acipenser sinensis]